jgi:hypothetical protein
MMRNENRMKGRGEMMRREKQKVENSGEEGRGDRIRY